jgi:hypothetical protein
MKAQKIGTFLVELTHNFSSLLKLMYFYYVTIILHKVNQVKNIDKVHNYLYTNFK